MLGCSHLHHKRESLSLGGLRFATPRGRGMLGSASFGLVHCVVCELFLARMCLQADPFCSEASCAAGVLAWWVFERSCQPSDISNDVGAAFKRGHWETRR